MSWIAVGTAAVSVGAGMYNSNKANQAATKAANNELSPAEIAQQSLDVQINNAGRIFDNESSLQPQYADLNNEVLRQQLLGSGGEFDINAYWNSLTDAERADFTGAGEDQGISGPEWLKRTAVEQAQRGYPKYQGVLDQYRTKDPNSLTGIIADTTKETSAIQAGANTAQRTADIVDVENLGARATAAYKAANPELAASMDSLSGRVNGGAFAGSGGANQIYAQESSLLAGMRDQARNGLTNLSPLQQELERQSMGELQLNGRLSAGATRDAEQAVRAAAADRGMVMSNSTIFNEAFHKDSLVRQRQAAARDLALGVDKAGQDQLGNNRKFALDVTGYDQDLNKFNAAQGNDMSMFNADHLRMLNNDQFSREYSLANLQANQAQNPFSLVTGRSAAPAQAGGLADGANAMQPGPKFTSLFDDTTSSILNTNYNAQQNAYLNQANNYGAVAGSFFEGGLGLAGDIYGNKGGGG